MMTGLNVTEQTSPNQTSHGKLAFNTNQTYMYFSVAFAEVGEILVLHFKLELKVEQIGLSKNQICANQDIFCLMTIELPVDVRSEITDLK